jgi:hypothetical protein
MPVRHYPRRIVTALAGAVVLAAGWVAAGGSP